mgnify:CR=1 FL=1
MARILQGRVDPQSLVGRKVRVHRNLHTGGYSISVRGRVKAHVDSVTLCNAKFVVRPSGQARARREQVKNVHAFVEGTITDLIETVPEDFEVHGTWIPWRFSYNPYKNDTFVLGKDTPLTTALVVLLTPNGTYAMPYPEEQTP